MKTMARSSKQKRFDVRDQDHDWVRGRGNSSYQLNFIATRIRLDTDLVQTDRNGYLAGSIG